MKIRLCQFNSTTGELKNNLNKLFKALERSHDEGVDLMLLPSNFLAGYVLEDLSTNNVFLTSLEDVTKQLAEKTKGLNAAIVISIPTIQGADTLLHIHNGQVEELVTGVLDINGMRACFASQSNEPNVADLIIVLENSPFALKQNRIATYTRYNAPLVYLNGVGGQDEAVFDGESFILNEKRELIAQMKSCEEDVMDITVTKEGDKTALDCQSVTTLPSSLRYDETGTMTSELEKIYKVLVLGLRDYMQKSGFKKAVVGLSGGIDSALVAAVATDAIGGSNLRCVRLPSMYSSSHSLIDAEETAKLLGATLNTLPIKETYQRFEKDLSELFTGRSKDTTEENLQARIRGVLLMSISNKFNELLLNTGNKSEGAMGYATLYGDTCGGFDVLKDLYKCTVYALSKWRNENHIDWFYGPKGQVIPDNILLKEPSAELKEGQKDSDSLPPYPVLDKILKQLIEENKSFSEILSSGIDKNTLIKVINMLCAAEYKRRQEPPGIVISKHYKTYPITNKFKLEEDVVCSAIW